MQRNYSDIVADIDFLAHGLSYEAPADAASSRQQPTAAAGRQREAMPPPGQIGITLDRDYEESVNQAEARAAWLRRQQDLIDSLADEIARHALESCSALHLADANTNVSALCEYRDADLRQLLADVTRRREQLKNRLARDRTVIGLGAGEGLAAFESGRQSKAFTAPDEIS